MKILESYSFSNNSNDDIYDNTKYFIDNILQYADYINDYRVYYNCEIIEYNKGIYNNDYIFNADNKTYLINNNGMCNLFTVYEIIEK